MAAHSSTLAWKIPWMEEPGRLQSMGSLRVGVAKSRTRLSDFLSLFTFMHWRRKWQPTSVFLPGESQGRGLDKAPYITVCFTRPDGTPYGVPLSLARTDDKTFYFHCALEGDKLDCIAANPRVALSAVTRCTPTTRSSTMISARPCTSQSVSSASSAICSTASRRSCNTP